MEEEIYRKQEKSIDFSIAKCKILLQNGKNYQPSWRQKTEKFSLGKIKEFSFFVQEEIVIHVQEKSWT